VVDGQALRELQAPLKARYREEPTAAVVTLHADGTLGDAVTCSVQTGRALAVAGLHPATGGDGADLCSGDMLLQALAGCAGVTLRSVATARGIEVSGTIRVEGDLDFRGTLGVDKTAPVGFAAIRVRFDLTSPAPADDLAALIATTERYCVVLQTIASPPPVTMTYQRA
jgi:uncharacterized OsmC-like protein